MKKTSLIAVLTVVFLGLLYTTSFAMSFNPVNDLSGWGEDTWTPNNPVKITHTGSSVSFVADGTSGEAWGNVFKTLPGSIGITAEVSVSAVRGTGNIGIRKYIATTDSGTSLMAEMLLLERWSGDEIRIIVYDLVERDSSGHTIRQLGGGVFGDLTPGTVEWNVGDDVFLGVALVGNEVWFYTPGYDTLLKIQILIPFTPSDGEISILGWSPTGSANHIEGTVKNVNIIYP